MKSLFISDLHLSSKRPDISALFFHFLKNHAMQADALYILGDFFETWVGMDALDAHEQSIITALKQYRDTGKALYFMHGNRDFLINQSFTARTGATLITEPYSLPLSHSAGIHWVLCHGDALCTLDLSYQRYRKLVRLAWIKAFFLILPAFIRKKIAEKLRHKSRLHQQQYISQPEKWDVTPEAVEELLKQRQATVLLHGHTHKPNIHPLLVNNIPCKRIVLGDWGNTGNFLTLDNEQCDFKEFNEAACWIKPLRS